MNYIQGHGSTNPKAFFIADGPFGEDLRTGKALTGIAERSLRKFCQEADLHLDEFWRTCLIKNPEHKINYDTKGKKNNTPIDQSLSVVPSFAPLLIDEIKQLDPYLLIPQGEISFRWLTGQKGIYKFRGSVLPSVVHELGKQYKVLPILGQYPYLNQDYKYNFITKVDYAKISKYLNDAPIPDTLYNIWIARNANSLRNFLERAYPACIQRNSFLVFDIETFYGIPTCISFCFDGYESVCIPIIDSSIDLDNRVLMMDMVARVLKSPIPKKNQNIKYDWKTQERWKFKVENVTGDSMLAASCLYSEFPKNLGFLTSIYTDLPYFKDEGRQFDPSKHKKEQFYLYNAKDSLATHQTLSKQDVEMQEKGVSEIYQKLIQIMPIYRRMEDTGIRIDAETQSKLYGKYESLFNIEVLKLRKLAGNNTLNPMSSPQMNTLVFDTLGYTKIQGVKGTDNDSLDLLLELGTAKYSPIHGKDILECITNARKFHKVIEIITLFLHPDGRFRGEFNLGGTENARTSGGQSTDYFLYFNPKKKNAIDAKNLGHSLQNIGKHGFSVDGVTYGKDIRNMFVADRGYIFKEIDLSQAEARVDAVLAGNFDILSVFDSPTGIHRLTGSWVYNCSPESIKKGVLVDGEDRYHVAKQVRHAGERNITAKGLVTKLIQGMAVKRGQQVLDIFHKFQPEIRGVFHRDVIQALRTTQMLVAPNGRLREFFDRPGSKQDNEAISFLPQAIVADHMKFEGILKTCTEMPDVLPIVEAHDGVLSLVPKEKDEEFTEKVQRNLSTPIDFRKGSIKRDYQLVIPSEAGSGENWGEIEEDK